MQRANHRLSASIIPHDRLLWEQFRPWYLCVLRHCAYYWLWSRLTVLALGLLLCQHETWDMSTSQCQYLTAPPFYISAFLHLGHFTASPLAHFLVNGLLLRL
jgi:hypothetical protein